MALKIGSSRPKSAKPGSSTAVGVKEKPYRSPVDNARAWSGSAGIVNDAARGNASQSAGKARRRAQNLSPVVKIPRDEARSAMLLDARHGVLLIVDVQARLAPAVAGAEAIIARTRILLAAAAR